MNYKLLSIKDTYLLTVSAFFILFNIYVQPILYILIYPSLIITFCNIVKNYLNYNKNKEIAVNYLLNTIIININNISIYLSIFNIAGILVPLGINEFNIYFLTICILLALFQNTISTIFQLIPTTINRSSNELVINLDCESIVNELQYIKNIKKFIYVISFIFFIESIHNYNFYNLAIVLLIIFYYYAIITYFKLSNMQQYVAQNDEQLNGNIYLVCWKNQQESIYAICFTYMSFLLLKKLNYIL